MHITILPYMVTHTESYQKMLIDAIEAYWEYEETYKPRPRLGPDPDHGLPLYRRGCRCDECRAANARRQRERRHRAKYQEALARG